MQFDPHAYSASGDLLPAEEQILYTFFFFLHAWGLIYENVLYLKFISIISDGHNTNTKAGMYL